MLERGPSRCVIDSGLQGCPAGEDLAIFIQHLLMICINS